MRLKGALIGLIFLTFLLTACEENKLTGKATQEDPRCIDLQSDLYDSPSCNLNCKAAQTCEEVTVEGKKCYECQDRPVEEWDELSCWNGAVWSGADLGNRTRFKANHTNSTSSYQFFCIDDCPPDYACDWDCVCRKQKPKITCDKIKQKQNNQPLSARPDCDGRCPPNLCRAYNVAQFGLVCYACVQPDCPPPTMRLQDCMLRCDNGQCVPRMAVGGQACYTCEEYTDTRIPDRPVTQPNWDQYHPQDQVVTQPTGDQERVTTPQPVDCNQYCSGQGLSPTPVDYSGYIRSYVNQYQCVSGARIRIQTRSYGDCRCYPQQPEITIDQTPPVCRGTPCGDVACGQSASCSCGERCTQTVTCSWGGWQIGSQSAVPIVGAKAS